MCGYNADILWGWEVLEPMLRVGFPTSLSFCKMGWETPQHHHPPPAEPGTPPSTAAKAGPMVSCPLERGGPEPQERGTWLDHLLRRPNAPVWKQTRGPASGRAGLGHGVS